MIEKGSDEWLMFSELFKLYQLASEHKFDDTEWSGKFFDELSNFKKKNKHISIAKKFADAIELDNLEHFDRFKANRWKEGK